jgi:hypothetical protein
MNPAMIKMQKNTLTAAAVQAFTASAFPISFTFLMHRLLTHPSSWPFLRRTKHHPVIMLAPRQITAWTKLTVVLEFSHYDSITHL